MYPRGAPCAWTRSWRCGTNDSRNTARSDALVGLLRRLIQRLTEAFPKAKIRVRLDGGFAAPEVLDFLDCEPKVEYLVNFASNAVLMWCQRYW